jgi:uncharacterized repeat protein (TIGR02543 family)
MLKKSFLVLIALTALAACKLPFTAFTPVTSSSAHSLTISWHVGSAGAHTILPASYPMPATYDVLLHPTSGSDVSQTGLTSTTWTFNNLSAVVYTITVTGMDSGGKTIVSGTGSADMTAVAVQNPSITLQYISTGTGTGQIQLTFNASSAGITVTSTSMSLVDPSGAIIVNDASLTGSSPIFTYTNSSAKVGSYQMFAKFSTGSQVAMKIDTIIVVQNVDTIATILLASGDFHNAYVPVTGLSLNINTMNLSLGGATGTLAATLSPTSASNTLVTWSSSASSIAVVNQSGVVTAVGGGSATITATSVDNSAANASCTVNVLLNVTYNGNGNTGGSVPVDSNNYLQGATVTVPGNTGNLVKTAYNFIGWNTEANGSGTTYTQGQTFSMDTANVTLYAAWSPAGSTWTTRTLPSSASWYSVTYGNGVFVAVAWGNAAATSPDGITWTARTLPSPANWMSVTYGNGVFVAVAYNSTAEATSPDGITWTARTLPSPLQWSSVTYGNGVFIAVAHGQDAASSPDGITWTWRTLPRYLNWESVTYGNAVFVAVGSASNVAATSPDGITWTARTLPPDYWRSVTYGNGVFVAVTASTAAATSPDGNIWTARTLPSSSGWISVTYGNGVFVAVGSASNAAATSPDGITWTARTLPSSANWLSVTYGNGVFVAVVYNSTAAATSP